MGIIKGVTTVVYGPQGCGKTTHAEALAEFLGCARVVDGDWRSGVRLAPGALHLTSETPAEMPAEVLAGARVLSFGQVMTLQAVASASGRGVGLHATRRPAAPPPTVVQWPPAAI